MPWKGVHGLEEADLSDEEMESSLQESSGLQDGLMQFSTGRSVQAPLLLNGRIALEGLLSNDAVDEMADEEDDEIQESD